MTKILFYTSEPERFSREISWTLTLAASNRYQLQTIYDLDILGQALHNENAAAPILVLAAMNDYELDMLHSLRQTHVNLPVILIVADTAKQTLTKARRFNPTFLTTVEEDYVCVLSVLEYISNLMSNNCCTDQNVCCQENCSKELEATIH